jgi:hypothetical protein
VRDLRRSIEQGFDSSDLTLFASHLVEGYTIVDWAYRRSPHSVIWAVRDDGTLLGLTYLREQDIWGWHRHDTDGAVENVCVVPEGTEDAVYLVVKRTVNGATKRYVERLTSRSITKRTDVRDLVFCDASLAYDGRNAGAETMTLTGGVTWDYTETLTITRSVGGFTAGDVGNAIQLFDAAATARTITLHRLHLGHGDDGQAERHRARGAPRRCDAQLGARRRRRHRPRPPRGESRQRVRGWLCRRVAEQQRRTARRSSSPAGRSRSRGRTASSRSACRTLADLETLDIDTASGPSLKDRTDERRRCRPHGARLARHLRRPAVARYDPLNTDGDPLFRLQEAKIRESEAYTSPVALLTGDVDVSIEANWNSNGRVFIRQVDPLPLTVLSARPQGQLPVAA